MAKLVGMNRTLDRDNEVRDFYAIVPTNWANFRRGEPGKPNKFFEERRRLPFLSSFQITHCLAGSVRNVILSFYLPNF